MCLQGVSNATKGIIQNVCFFIHNMFKNKFFINYAHAVNT